MSEEKTITVMGKTINYGNLSNEKLLQLYRELKQRESILCKRIKDYDEKYNIIEEINSNNN